MIELWDDRAIQVITNTGRTIADELASAGELANMIKKRWRDGADLTEEIRDEIADIRVYLELIAKCFNVEGDKLDQRVLQKLAKVVEKHKVLLSL